MHDIDFGSDYDIDLDSIDNTSCESIDEGDYDSLESSDSLDDSIFCSFNDESYETVDGESEINYAESVEGVEVFNLLESLGDRENSELLESVIETDSNSFDNVESLNISEDFIEFPDMEQEADSNSLDTIENFDGVGLLADNRTEIKNENSEMAMHIMDLEDTAINDNIASTTSDVSLEDMETLIDNTEDIDQLYELRDLLVNGDVEDNIPSENFDGLEESRSDATTDRLEALYDSLLSDEIANEADGTADDGPKILTREITPEIIESRERDMEETLENYQENLREYGVSEEQIYEFVEREREKINNEYESLDRGDISSNIYNQPTNWEEVATSLSFEEGEQICQDVSGELEIDREVEHSNAELQELSIDYDEIYGDIQQEAIEESFADIHIDANPKRLENSLDSFNEGTWRNLTLDEQKDSMETLADYVIDVIGFKNPPTIDYYNNMQEGDFGGYDPSTNTLHVNEYLLFDSKEAADTIAHELWHAHQHECAINPQKPRDYQYQYNFQNYIPPELGQEAYESQLVEAEARSFAAQFKDRLEMKKGRMD